MCCQRNHCGCCHTSQCGQNCGCRPQPICGWEYVCHRPMPLSAMEEAATSLSSFRISEESSGCGCG